MKKFTYLLLMFSIFSFSGNMYAHERKGEDIEIYTIRQVVKPKMEGPEETPNINPDIKGELIAVKEDSLLLIDRDSGADIAVKIGDIRAIRIVKKSKALLGVGLGVLIGGVSGALIGTASTDKERGSRFIVLSPEINTVFYGTLVGVIGAMIGGAIGGTIGAGAGKLDSEIQKILEKLRKKARIKNAQ